MTTKSKKNETEVEVVNLQCYDSTGWSVDEYVGKSDHLCSTEQL